MCYYTCYIVNSEFELHLKVSIESRIFYHVTRYSEEELQQHIQKLHEYNEIKDVGQLLIGKLGNLK